LRADTQPESNTTTPVRTTVAHDFFDHGGAPTHVVSSIEREECDELV
jgi:hypothetical protein